MRPSVRDYAIALIFLAGLSGPAFAQPSAPDEAPAADSPATSATIEVTATRVSGSDG